MMRHTRLVVTLTAGIALGLSACAGTSGFGLSAGDNNPEKLSAAMQTVQAPSAGPINSTGKPMVFLAARGQPKQLVAFDLEAKAELWRVDADIRSKVIVGRDFVAHKQGDGAFVARDVLSGKQLWSVPIGGTFVGAAADANNVYITVKLDSKHWTLRALDGKSGTEIWDLEAPGVLGAPAARGGLVFDPFMKQWLTIISAKDGTMLTRVRGIDEEISFVRTTPNEVYFGSKAGVFLLDERAASGKRSQSTYGSAMLPEHFKRVHYHWDAFDAVQAGYSAYDRNRILWNGLADGEKLGFSNDIVTVQTYRFFFGFGASSGDLKWAYNHPRVDIVASNYLGASIGIASMTGEIGALDPVTGQKIYEAKVEGQFVGGTFDATGWAPSESIASSGSTAAALASIARDRDARFNDVKKYAVQALAQLKGPDVSKDLLTLIQHEKTPPYLRQTAADALVSRKDASGLVHLVAALQIRNNYVEGTRARAIGIVAQAIAALDPEGIDPRLRGEAIDGLLFHLNAPDTTTADLIHLVHGLGRLGADTSALKPLSSFLLIYRADPAFATQVEVIAAVVDVLLGQGGAEERATVAFVAEDALTLSAIANHARNALLARPAKPTKATGTKAAPGATKRMIKAARPTLKPQSVKK